MTARSTPAEMLRLIGTALYGDRWLRPLARELGRDEAQLRHWLAGKGLLGPDHSLFAAALRLLARRCDEIGDTHRTLERFISA